MFPWSVNKSPIQVYYCHGPFLQNATTKVNDGIVKGKDIVNL